MKIGNKRAISLIMCVMLLVGVMGVSALAVSADNYKNLDYKYYTYIGDSIPWGYGLDLSVDTHEASSVCFRMDGAYPDLVGKVLEQNNGATVKCAASSGARLSDFRVLLERGMGVENPYTPAGNDWFGERAHVRTHTLRDKGPQICEWVRNSDLVTVQLGINDITTTFVNALNASGIIDLSKITAISDTDSFMEYIASALNSVRENPNVLGKVIAEFNSNIIGLRVNAAAVLKDVVELAPADADILVVGYHNVAKPIRVIPNSAFSPVFDVIGAAVVSLNDYFAALASQYSNVHYVDAPDATEFYKDGTLLTDALAHADGILLGLHPDAPGHEYIAQRVLDALEGINTCQHSKIKNVSMSVKTPNGYEYTSTQVCADCGQLLDTGKVTTPYGSVDVPHYTMDYTGKSVTYAVNTSITKTICFAQALLGKQAG